MINIKKGTAHSLQQSDKIGNAKSGEAVVAGMLVRIDSNGDVVKGVSAQGVADTLGFAINNQTDGDVLESGKIGFILLDGNSVIETDQASSAITAGACFSRIRMKSMPSPLPPAWLPSSAMKGSARYSAGRAAMLCAFT